LESREDRQPDPNLDTSGHDRPASVEGASRAAAAERDKLNTPGHDHPAAEVPPEPTIGQWLAQNGAMLALIGGGLLYLYLKFGPELLWVGVKVAIGLGFVIFIHELGHFLVAKWCDVHVQVFSIGFGPALPGCRFTWGETTYKLALIPLGGYVQMVGQVDGDESADGSDDDPRSYRNKSVWQRMAIISAGVTMNAILAVICFVIVFRGPGKDRAAGVIGRLDTNMVAFQAGVPPGAVIRQIGDIRDPNFEDLMRYVIATTDGEKVLLRYQVPGQAEKEVEIEPRLGPGDLRRPMLGIGPAKRLVLLPERYARRQLDGPVFPKTAAAAATPPLAFGDVIVATTDPDNPSAMKDLPPDPRKPGSDQRDYFEFARRLRLLAGQKLTIRVQRGPEDARETLDITIPPAYHNVLGARMEMGQVTVVCDDTPASRDPINRLQARTSNLEGDVIQRVEVLEPDGSTTTFDEGFTTTFTTREPAAHVAAALTLPGLVQPWLLYQSVNNQAPLDPERLPLQLRQWAQRMAKARRPLDQWVVTLHVRRHNQITQTPGVQYRTEVVRLPWDTGRSYGEVVPLSWVSPLAIPELGLAYQIKTTVAAVDPVLAGTGPDTLQPRDEIKQIRFYQVGKDDELVESNWVELEPDQWARASYDLQGPGHDSHQVEKVTLKVLRNKESKELTLYVRQDTTWPQPERGLILDTDVRRQKADTIIQAVVMGLKDTHNSMMQVYQNLRGMVTGRISPKNLGGPVTIARAAYNIAGVDFWEFIFFLGLISINLAVINFLPIPVLDGGHMVFLLYEKVRGKPASEQVRIGATYAGLLLLASLMIFVLYLDISRVVRGG
jgi:regulator of sigma E protease